MRFFQRAIEDLEARLPPALIPRVKEVLSQDRRVNLLRSEIEKHVAEATRAD